MAFCIWSIISLMYFWTPFFVRIHHYDCLTLQPVDSCPENLFEVKAATIRLKCSDVKEFKNVYHCLPLSNLSRLVEFCYDGVSGLTEKGNCMVLENQHLNNHSCNQFTKGCPDAPYFPKNMFSFPACKQINKQNRCYVADPTCPPIISFVEETTVEVMKNNTVLVQGMMPTVTTKENNTFLTNKINPVLLTVAIAAIASTVALIALVITMKTKHRRSTKGRKIYQGNHNLNEGKYLLHQEDNITKRGVRFDIYECNGDRIRFIRLLDCLKNEIKETELISLKEYLKGLVPVKSLNEESLEKADSVKKFVDFVISEGIFTDRDVIIMQCLMRLIKRPKLDQECVDYATKKKERVCYFQEKEPGNENLIDKNIYAERYSTHFSKYFHI